MEFCEIDHKKRVLIPGLLEKWDKTLREMEETLGVYDLPYVYGERTNIGILASAAAKLGYLTLEEYSTEKRRSRKWNPGRADIYICRKDGQQEFNIEAKYDTVSFNSYRLAQKIGRLLDEAAKDVKKLRPYARVHRLGVAFLRPYGARPDDFDPTPFWTQLRDRASYGGSFCALHLCKYEIWSKHQEHVGCPGIAIVGKYVS
jgi:hypothetical protein